MDSWVALATPVRRVARESTFHKTMDWRFYARNSLDARSLIRLLKFRLLSRSESSSTVPVRGTEGSNPVPSSAESRANLSLGERPQESPDQRRQGRIGSCGPLSSRFVSVSTGAFGSKIGSTALSTTRHFDWAPMQNNDWGKSTTLPE